MSVWVDKKYLNLISPQLEKFTWKTDSKANHRCPFCGDSKKDPNKARGNHIVQNDFMLYKCFNCGLSTSTGKVIEFINPSIYNEYKLEKYVNGSSSNSQSLPFISDKKEDINYQERSILDKVLDNLLSLPEDNIAIKYVKSRKIPEDKWNQLYYIDDITKLKTSFGKELKAFQREDMKEPRLILPCYDRKGRISSLIARSFDPNHPKKYLIGKVQEDGPKIFGYDIVDFSRTIIVVEGPIDSLFLNNCVGSGGADLHKIGRWIPMTDTILVYDNQPRNKEIVRIIQKTINKGFTISILPDKFGGKDINDAILSGFNSKEIENEIINNKCSGIKAQLMFNNWKKV